MTATARIANVFDRSVVFPRWRPYIPPGFTVVTNGHTQDMLHIASSGIYARDVGYKFAKLLDEKVCNQSGFTV